MRRWLMEACFPFWAENGVDPRGGFHERLALNGAPLKDETSRVRVQARQTFIFAEAARLGFDPTLARALVGRGVDALLGPCRRPDFLFGKIVRPGEGLADPQPELYDNAFCLLALAAAAQALRDDALLDAADKTIAALDANLAHPKGGFHETAPPRLPRRQNPHMHLFEALLALQAAAPDRGYIQRADQIFALFCGAFFDPGTGALREFFDDAWTADRAAPLEPGHMFEWTWLLNRYAALKSSPAPAAARALYDAALPCLDAGGFAPQSGRFSRDAGWAAVDATRRAWPQTEALKAHLSVGERARADALVDTFFATYLAGTPAGAWRDHFDADGMSLARDIPASTGYHIVLAFSEYMKRDDIIS